MIKSQNYPWTCWQPHPCWMPEMLKVMKPKKFSVSSLSCGQRLELPKGDLFVCLFFLFWKAYCGSDWMDESPRHLEWKQNRTAHHHFLPPPSKTSFILRKFNSAPIPGITSTVQKSCFLLPIINISFQIYIIYYVNFILCLGKRRFRKSLEMWLQRLFNFQDALISTMLNKSQKAPLTRLPNTHWYSHITSCCLTNMA